MSSNSLFGLCFQQDEKGEWAHSYSSNPCLLPTESDDFGDPEKLLAQAMTDMTVQERNHALEDVHGVADLEEDPSDVQNCLDEFADEVARQKTRAYVLAENSSPDYVSNRDFRLMFLRADMFDARKAVQRMMTYFEHKLWLFGGDKLTSDIKQSDLSPEDLEFLADGSHQILSKRDRAGRPVLLVFPPAVPTFKDPMNTFRALFYFLTTVIRNPERKGVTGVIYNTMGNKMRNVRISWMMIQLRHSFPLQGTSVHLCLPPRESVSIASLLIRFQSKQTRSRTRIHFGTDVECQYQLQAFGIDLSPFPVDLAGKMDLSMHCRWLEEQRQLENSAIPTPCVSVVATISTQPVSDPHPGAMVVSDSKGDDRLEDVSWPRKDNEVPDNAADEVSGSRRSRLSSTVPTFVTPLTQDVLFGRGKGSMCHPGNKCFRKLVELHYSEYEKASKFEKTLIFGRIIQTMRASGARFLKLVNLDHWVEVDERTAHSKVSQCFRTLRKVRA